MNLFKLLLSLPVIGALSFSCVKTGAEECPPQTDAAQYTVHIGILDKNYTDVQTIDPASVKDESQPLQFYVDNLSYELVREGEATPHSAQTVPAGAAKTYDLAFKDLTPGRYTLTVWANAKTPGVLHEGGDEGTDVYLGRATIDYTGSGSSDLLLQRTKGLVKVVYKNLPPSIVKIRQQFGPVYQNVDAGFAYSGETTVMKTVPAASAVTMFVAPSLLFRSSTLTIQFFTADDGDTPSITLPSVTQKVQRNGLTLVEVDYGTETGSFEIWTTVEGQWTLVHDETLHENL